MDETTDPLLLKLTTDLATAVMEWRARAELLTAMSDDDIVESLYNIVKMATAQGEARELMPQNDGSNVVSLVNRRLLAKGYSVEDADNPELTRINAHFAFSINSSVLDALVVHVGGDTNDAVREIVRRGVLALEGDATGAPTS